MTGQIHDLVEYDGTTYWLAQTEGHPLLFDPCQYGFAPEMISTGCYRGYYCTYSIIEDKLYLKYLVINDRGAATKTLNGKSPLRPSGHLTRRHDQPDLDPLRGRYTLNSGTDDKKKWYHVGCDGYIYSNIMLPMTDFTGRMVLGANLDPNKYVHAGFQSPSAFNIVREIYFENGVLCQTLIVPPASVASLSCRVETKIREWAQDEYGKPKNLPKLLGTLDQILWSEAKWTPVEAQLLMNDARALKRAYFKATTLVHPDKVILLAPEQRLLAKRIFDILCQAKKRHDDEGNATTQLRDLL